MPSYRVAVNEQGLVTAPIVEADGPAVAASQYVSDNNLQGGSYLVLEVVDPSEVDVTITHTVEAKLVHQGGVPATTESVEPEEPSDG